MNKRTMSGSSKNKVSKDNGKTRRVRSGSDGSEGTTQSSRAAGDMFSRNSFLSSSSILRSSALQTAGAFLRGTTSVAFAKLTGRSKSLPSTTRLSTILAAGSSPETASSSKSKENSRTHSASTSPGNSNNSSSSPSSNSSISSSTSSSGSSKNSLSGRRGGAKEEAEITGATLALPSSIAMRRTTLMSDGRSIGAGTSPTNISAGTSFLSSGSSYCKRSDECARSGHSRSTEGSTSSSGSSSTSTSNNIKSDTSTASGGSSSNGVVVVVVASSAPVQNSSSITRRETDEASVHRVCDHTVTQLRVTRSPIHEPVVVTSSSSSSSHLASSSVDAVRVSNSPTSHCHTLCGIDVLPVPINMNIANNNNEGEEEEDDDLAAGGSTVNEHMVANTMWTTRNEPMQENTLSYVPCETNAVPDALYTAASASASAAAAAATYSSPVEYNARDVEHDANHHHLVVTVGSNCDDEEAGEKTDLGCSSGSNTTVHQSNHDDAVCARNGDTALLTEQAESVTGSVSPHAYEEQQTGEQVVCLHADSGMSDEIGCLAASRSSSEPGSLNADDLTLRSITRLSRSNNSNTKNNNSNSSCSNSRGSSSDGTYSTCSHDSCVSTTSSRGSCCAHTSGVVGTNGSNSNSGCGGGNSNSLLLSASSSSSSSSAAGANSRVVPSGTTPPWSMGLPARSSTPPLRSNPLRSRNLAFVLSPRTMEEEECGGVSTERGVLSTASMRYRSSNSRNSSSSSSDSDSDSNSSNSAMSPSTISSRANSEDYDGCGDRVETAHVSHPRPPHALAGAAATMITLESDADYVCRPRHEFLPASSPDHHSHCRRGRVCGRHRHHHDENRSTHAHCHHRQPSSPHVCSSSPTRRLRYTCNLACPEERFTFLTRYCVLLAQHMKPTTIVKSLLPAMLTAFECDEPDGVELSARGDEEQADDSENEDEDSCDGYDYPCDEACLCSDGSDNRHHRSFSLPASHPRHRCVVGALAHVLPDVIACMGELTVPRMQYVMGLLLQLCAHDAGSRGVRHVTRCLQRIVAMLPLLTLRRLFVPLVRSLWTSPWAVPRAIAAGVLGSVVTRLWDSWRGGCANRIESAPGDGSPACLTRRSEDEDDDVHTSAAMHDDDDDDNRVSRTLGKGRSRKARQDKSGHRVRNSDGQNAKHTLSSSSSYSVPHPSHGRRRRVHTDAHRAGTCRPSSGGGGSRHSCKRKEEEKGKEAVVVVVRGERCVSRQRRRRVRALCVTNARHRVILEWFDLYMQSSADESVLVREAGVRGLGVWTRLVAAMHRMSTNSHDSTQVHSDDNDNNNNNNNNNNNSSNSLSTEGEETISFDMIPMPLVRICARDATSDVVRYTLVHEIVEHMAPCLGKQNTTRWLLPIFLTLCQDVSWRVRFSAAQQLARMAHRVAHASNLVDALRLLASDEESAVRAAVARTLGAFVTQLAPRSNTNSNSNSTADGLGVCTSAPKCAENGNGYTSSSPMRWEMALQQCVEVALRLGRDAEPLVRRRVTRSYAPFLLLTSRRSTQMAIAACVKSLMQDNVLAVQMDMIQSLQRMVGVLERQNVHRAGGGGSRSAHGSHKPGRSRPSRENESVGVSKESGAGQTSSRRVDAKESSSGELAHDENEEPQVAERTAVEAVTVQSYKEEPSSDALHLSLSAISHAQQETGEEQPMQNVHAAVEHNADTQTNTNNTIHSNWNSVEQEENGVKVNESVAVTASGGGAMCEAVTPATSLNDETPSPQGEWNESDAGEAEDASQRPPRFPRHHRHRHRHHRDHHYRHLQRNTPSSEDACDTSPHDDDDNKCSHNNVISNDRRSNISSSIGTTSSGSQTTIGSSSSSSNSSCCGNSDSHLLSRRWSTPMSSSDSGCADESRSSNSSSGGGVITQLSEAATASSPKQQQQQQRVHDDSSSLSNADTSAHTPRSALSSRASGKALLRDRARLMIGLILHHLTALGLAHNWRVRIAVVHVVPHVCRVISESQFGRTLAPVLRTLLRDPVSAVREATIESLGKIAAHYGPQLAAQLMSELLYVELSGSAQQSSFVWRVMTIRCMQVLLPVVCGLGMHDLRRCQIIHISAECVQRYAGDGVSQVRLAVARGLSVWRSCFANASPQHMQVYEETCARLSEDVDVDVMRAAVAAVKDGMVNEEKTMYA